MKAVAEYITEKDAKEFCSECNEICGRHCVIWRKALHAYDAEEIEEQRQQQAAAERGITCR